MNDHLDDTTLPTLDPFELPLPPPVARPTRSGAARIATIAGCVAAALVISGVFVGFRYHTDYREIVPGDALRIDPLIHVTGTKVYKPQRGEFDLLFVRERDHVNYWQYLWAKYFDDNATLEREAPEAPAVSNDVQNSCDMTDSQTNAKVVALTKLGYKIAIKPGVQVMQVSSRNAARALRCLDVIRTVDGEAVDSPDALHNAVNRHTIGDTIVIGYDRGGKRATTSVKLSRGKDDDHDPTNDPPIIGVTVQQPSVLPFQINIDTSDIGGPSAGLSMTLTLLDVLTPGELTGGKRVAVTGTIELDGSVGPIGGTPQKVIAARDRGVQLMLVAAGSDDLGAALRKAGTMEIVVVHTLDDALRALEAAGGDPLPTTATK